MATIHTTQCHTTNHINSNIDILKTKLQETLEDIDGQIWIIPDAVFSTESHQISVDIVLVGYLKGYGSDKKNYSFVTAVEVKHHSIEGLSLKGDKLFAEYHNGVINVTNQSYMQKISVAEALNKTNTNPPYVSSLIWLDNISTSELQSITLPDIITADFSAENLLNKIIREATHSEEEVAAMAEILCKGN